MLKAVLAHAGSDRAKSPATAWRFASGLQQKACGSLVLSVLYVGGRQRLRLLPPSCKGLGQLQPRRRRLILDGLVFRRRPCLGAGSGGVCVSLSSFQRTKALVSLMTGCPRSLPLSLLLRRRPSGEPYEITAHFTATSTLFSSRNRICEPVCCRTWGRSLAASAFDRRRCVKRVSPSYGAN